MPLPPVGLQTGVLHKTYKWDRDADLILDKLQELGYAAVEGGGDDAAAFRRKLDARGLRYAATHMAMSAKPDIGQMIEYLHTVGGADICNSGINEWSRPGLSHFTESIKSLNELGRRLRGEGIHLHYHNHAFEFDKIDGDRSGMDCLIDGLDFSVIDLCVDVAWVWRGGQNPAEFLRRHKDKVGYLHFKDTDKTQWHELGRGSLDWKSIMAVLPELKACRWNCIEQDSTKLDPLESVAISRRFLRDTFNY
jgi:sugar phosphate isomerase/epimerase